MTGPNTTSHSWLHGSTRTRQNGQAQPAAVPKRKTDCTGLDQTGPDGIGNWELGCGLGSGVGNVGVAICGTGCIHSVCSPRRREDWNLQHGARSPGHSSGYWSLHRSRSHRLAPTDTRCHVQGKARGTSAGLVTAAGHGACTPCTPWHIIDYFIREMAAEQTQKAVGSAN